jgi:monothiol glutaredoxin
MALVNGFREEETQMTDPVHAKIQADINDNPVVLYMKGTPVFPQCGFSARVVQILSHVGVPFKGVNVLEDMAVREGIKSFSNWPTIPQLYVKGEFIGGCDIVTEMFQSGELASMLTEQGIAPKASA